MKKLFLFLWLISPVLTFSQQVFHMQKVNTPGTKSEGVIKGYVLGENLIYPMKVKFVGDKEEMSFKKKEAGRQSFDKTPTLYSGRIYSPGIIEPFVFENKTPEELVFMEIMVFPSILGAPYSLFIDMKVVTETKKVENKSLSDDAGTYVSKISVKLLNLE